MRIFENFPEMYSEVGRDLKELGTWRKSHSVQNIVVSEFNFDYDMMELTGYCFKLNSIDGIGKYMEDSEMNYLLSEAADRFSKHPLNPGTSWTHRDKVWRPFMKDGFFDYTYSERLCYQIPRVVKELKNRPGTRQAVLTMFRDADHVFMGGIKRIPCSLTYQFLLRDNEISVIYSMRSCDYFTHFKFDVGLAWLMATRIADQLVELPKVKSLTMMIGSFHAFRKDLEKVF